MFLRLSQLSRHSVVRFATVGLANSIFGLLVIYLMIWLLDLGNILANLIGYTFGFMLSFVLNSKWTFQYSGDQAGAFFRFALVVLSAYIANLLTVLMFIEILHVNNYVSQAMGIAPYALVGYLGSRFFAFSRQGNRND